MKIILDGIIMNGPLRIENVILWKILGEKFPKSKEQQIKILYTEKKKNLGLFKELKEAYYEMKENEQG